MVTIGILGGVWCISECYKAREQWGFIVGLGDEVAILWGL